MNLFIVQFSCSSLSISLHAKHLPQHFAFKQICSELRERKQVSYPNKRHSITVLYSLILGCSVIPTLLRWNCTEHTVLEIYLIWMPFVIVKC
jgi:hypothetical protein